MYWGSKFQNFSLLVLNDLVLIREFLRYPRSDHSVCCFIRDLRINNNQSIGDTTQITVATSKVTRMIVTQKVYFYLHLDLPCQNAVDGCLGCHG